MSQNSSDLSQYLEQIAFQSLDGSIEWTHPNPSIFHWIQDSGNGRFLVSIQKASSPLAGIAALSYPGKKDDSSDAGYLFEVTDMDSRQTLVSLSSKERRDLFPALSNIYSGAELAMDQRASKVLENLLRRR